MNKVRRFIAKETVLVISGLAALLSALLVAPSAQYFQYLDFHVLILLFCLMTVVAGLSKIGMFEILSQAFLKMAGSIRVISLILVLLCFFIAMLVTNDVALITMVPFTLALLDFAGERRLIFLIVMETVAANLGSMLTPIGNPQNLYLFSHFKMGMVEFLTVTFPVTAVSLLLISAVTMAVRSRKINVVFDVKAEIHNKGLLFLYIGLFCICLLTVLGMLNQWVCLGLVLILTLLKDRQVLKKVDYFLLMTFVFFFIFVGNMGRVDEIREVLSSLIDGRELLSAVLLSQVISNVPAAVMLSSFTDNAKELLLGVNIGGLGSLVASLASLISYKLYCARKTAQKGLYLKAFTAINLSFLIVLLLLFH